MPAGLHYPLFLSAPTKHPLTHQITEDGKIKACEIEKGKWIDAKAILIVKQDDIPAYGNIIGSHVNYARKSGNAPKARICPWGSHDLERLRLRTDCPSMLMEIFRILLSICEEKGWSIGSMDAIAVFLNANGFVRIIYILPVREEKSMGILWQLLAPAYVLVDSGRL